jgi:hypothetical protein
MPLRMLYVRKRPGSGRSGRPVLSRGPEARSSDSPHPRSPVRPNGLRWTTKQGNENRFASVVVERWRPVPRSSGRRKPPAAKTGSTKPRRRRVLGESRTAPMDLVSTWRAAGTGASPGGSTPPVRSRRRFPWAWTQPIGAGSRQGAIRSASSSSARRCSSNASSGQSSAASRSRRRVAVLVQALGDAFVDVLSMFVRAAARL